MPKGTLDFQGLKRHLEPHIEAIVKDLVPDGRRQGKRWLFAGEQGGAGSSADFNFELGLWKDHALGDGPDNPAGDIFDLYRKVRGVTPGVAYRELSERWVIGGKPPKASPKLHIKRDFPAVPPPKGMKLGVTGSGRWEYRSAEGRTLFWVVRKDQVGGAKEVKPWRWHEEDGRWACKGWPAPRPLYNLDLLSQWPDRAVVVVEGEKVAEHLTKLNPPKHVVTTWCGGCGQVRGADWTPLSGRVVVLVPDCDEPGHKAMREIAQRLLKHGCTVHVALFEGQVNGWDVADQDWDSWDEIANELREVVRRSSLEKFLEPVGVEDAPTDDLPSRQKTQNTPALRVVDGGGRRNASAALNLAEPATKPRTWAELDLQLTGDGKPYANETNAYRILAGVPEMGNHIWHDEFYDDDLTDWPDGESRQLREPDLQPILRYMQYNVEIPSMKLGTLRGSVMEWAHAHPRNAPREWLAGLEWDRKPRIAGFLTDALGVAGTRYSLQVSRNFWLAMVARIVWPGCKADYMLILEGAQGDGKTSVLEAVGKKWYTDTKYKVGTLDFYQCMQGKALICLDELDSFRDVAQSTLKNMLTCNVDRYRASYDRRPYDRPRHCVFVGTTNKESYLQDETGNRRYWPVCCGPISVKYVEENRDQLFAEAYHRVVNLSQTWHEVDLVDATAEQESRREVDPWEAPITKWLLNKSEANIQEIAKECIGLDLAKTGRIEGRRIGKCLRAMGFVSKVFRRNNQIVRGWVTKNGLPFLGAAGQLELDDDEF